MPDAAQSPACSSCELRKFCYPEGVDVPLDPLNAFLSRRQRVAKGDSLFRRGDAAHCLYAIRSGTFKT